MKKIPHVSTSVLEELRNSIPLNSDRYASGNFADMARDARWKSKLDLEYDEVLLQKLHHDPKDVAASDRYNSEIIGVVFNKLTPHLACKEEIWVRLSHIECLEYSRARWLKVGEDKLNSSVNRHMFAPGRPGRRTDHAISRLWWTYYLAKTVRPSDPKSALAIITQTTDLRKLFFDAPWMIGRLDITRALVDVLESVPEIATENGRRAFMKAVNRAGGGKVFEVMSSSEVRITLEQCAQSAKT